MFWSLDVCLCLVAFCCKERSILAFIFWMMILQLMKSRSQNPIDAKNGIDDSWKFKKPKQRIKKWKLTFNFLLTSIFCKCVFLPHLESKGSWILMFLFVLFVGCVCRKDGATKVKTKKVFCFLFSWLWFYSNFEVHYHC